MASFDEVIPPGQVGKVTAQLRTENYRGPVEKVITVTSNDPIKSTLSLRLKANIVGSAQILPRPGMAFPSGMSWDFSGKIIVRKDETEKGELALSEVATNAPWLTAKARKVEKVEPAVGELPEAHPGDYVIDVTVGDDAPKTSGGFQLTFKTGLTREPTITVPISVVLQTPMRVMPSPLFLPETVDGKGSQASIAVTLRPGLGKEKLTAQASPDPFSVQLQPDGPHKYKALVTWKPTGDKPATDGNVIFHIGEESMTVLVRVANTLKPPAAAAMPPTPVPAPVPGGSGH